MESPEQSETEWNCLVKSTTGEAIHAAAVDGAGAIEEVACHPPVMNPWELTQPEREISYAACGRCISTGSFEEIPGVSIRTISSIKFDSERYEPPITSTKKPIP